MDITHDDVGIPMATYNQQVVYWRGACFFNTIAAIALIIIIREYIINKALRVQSLAPFFGQVRLAMRCQYNSLILLVILAWVGRWSLIFCGAQHMYHIIGIMLLKVI
jgi:predicted MFS family arabinose efflux permease